MRKKDLLKLEAVQLTDEIIGLVEADKGKIVTETYWNGLRRKYKDYNNGIFYVARVDGDVLQIGAWTRKLIAHGAKSPQFIIYLDRKEKKYITREVATGAWKTACITRLEYDLDKGEYWSGRKTWSSEETRQIVNDFCEYKEHTVREAVTKWQDGMRHRTEIERIDSDMDKVPEIPKEWDDWAVTDGFYREQYFIYKYKRRVKSGYCTVCKEEVNITEQPKHNKEFECPVCKRVLTAKSWDKQQVLADRKELGILQKLTTGEGYVMRKFHCIVERRKEYGYAITYAGAFETYRTTLSKEFVPMNRYKWDEFKNTHQDRWCFNSDLYSGESELEAITYPGNLKELLGEITELKYMPVEEILGKGNYVRIHSILRGCKQKPAIERLAKVGLYRLSRQIAAGEKSSINWGESSPWKMLGIKKEQIGMCVEMDIYPRQLETLQNANRLGMNLTREQLVFINSIFGPREMEKVFGHGHVEKMFRYLYENFGGNGRRCADYLDYMEDLRVLGVRITKAYLFPKDFQDMHMKIANQRRERDDRLKALEIAEKDKELQKMLPRLKRLYEMESEDMMIILPGAKEDFTREGQENHNCVGGSYYDKMLQGKSTVMFLRKKEDPSKSFCTVEMREDEIIQCRTMYNQSAPQEAWDFMKQVAEHYKKVMKEMIKEQELLVAAG